MVGQEPMVVAGEAHGRLGARMVFETMQPTTGLVLQTLMVLGLLVFAVTVVDLLLRGRFRNTAFALTGMLVPLAPLLGVCAAANAIMLGLIEVANSNISHPSFMAPILAEGALVVGFGAVVGAGAVVLKTILELVDGRRSRTPRAASERHP